MLCSMPCSFACGLHSNCEMEPSLFGPGRKSPRKWPWTWSANAWFPDSDEKVPAFVHAHDSLKLLMRLSDAGSARSFRIQGPSSMRGELGWPAGRPAPLILLLPKGVLRPATGPRAIGAATMPPPPSSRSTGSADGANASLEPPALPAPAPPCPEPGPWPAPATSRDRSRSRGGTAGGEGGEASYSRPPAAEARVSAGIAGGVVPDAGGSESDAEWGACLPVSAVLQALLPRHGPTHRFPRTLAWPFRMLVHKLAGCGMDPVAAWGFSTLMGDAGRRSSDAMLPPTRLPFMLNNAMCWQVRLDRMMRPAAPPAATVGDAFVASSLRLFFVPQPRLLCRILTAGRLIGASPDVGPGVVGIGYKEPSDALEADFQEAVEAVHAEGDYRGIIFEATVRERQQMWQGRNQGGQESVERTVTVDRFTLTSSCAHWCAHPESLLIEAIILANEFV